MNQHAATCARNLVREAADRGWSTAQLANTIHTHCGHSRLRSYRLAHGWTLEDVVAQVGKDANSTHCRLNTSRVSKWERGEEDPGRKYIASLCRVFQSDPMSLGLVPGMPDDTATLPPVNTQNEAQEVLLSPAQVQVERPTEPDGRNEMDRRSVLRSLALGLGVTAIPTSLSDAVGGLRRQLDETLSATNISDSTVDHWHAVADSYGRTYRTSPPVPFLVNVVQDITELRQLTDRRLPTAQRRGLCHATARMAGLLATTLINLSDHREARGWFQTAQRAADESEDPALRAWVLVRHAVSALYWNDPHSALDLATQTAMIARRIPCVAAAWAPAVQARALAQLARVEDARAAVGHAEEAFTYMEAGPSEQHAYGYTEAQLHFYRSNALTLIGDTTTAYQAQEAALTHYGPNVFLDPSLVHLDKAICLVRDGEIDQAARFASQSLIALPHEHRSPIVLVRARQITAAIPAARRSLPAVREFHEVLALGAPA